MMRGVFSSLVLGLSRQIGAPEIVRMIQRNHGAAGGGIHRVLHQTIRDQDRALMIGGRGVSTV